MSRLNLDPVISVQFEPARPDVDPPTEVGERFRDHLEAPPSREPSATSDSRPEPSNEQDRHQEDPAANEDRPLDESAPANHNDHAHENDHTRVNDHTSDSNHAHDHDHAREQEQVEPTAGDEPLPAVTEDRNEETADAPHAATSDAAITQEFDDHLVIDVPTETASDQGTELIVVDRAEEPVETDAEVNALEPVIHDKEDDSTPPAVLVPDSITQVPLEETVEDAIDTGTEVVVLTDDTVVVDSSGDEAPAETTPTNLVTAKSKITTDTLIPVPTEEETAVTPPIGEAPDTSPPRPEEIVSIDETEPTSEPVVVVIPKTTTTKKEPLAATTDDERDEKATSRRDGNRRVSNRHVVAKGEPAVHRPAGQAPPSRTSAAEIPEFQLQSVPDTSLPPTETGIDPNTADGNRDTSAVAKVETGATPTAVDRGGNARMAEKLLGAAATRQDGKVELRHVDQARFVQRVAGAIARAGQRDGEIHLRLSPPELGSLRLQIKVEEGALTARMEAENSAARGLILENLPTLRDRLAEQNIRIERFEVELGQQNQTGADQSRQHGESGQQQSGSPRHGNDIGSGSEPPDDEVAPAQRTIAEKQINVVV